MSQTDLILYNFTNLPELPVYPYSFVQIKALAKRLGIRVLCRDLSFINENRSRDIMARDIRDYGPRVIGLHLRQLDSLYADDYRNNIGEGFGDQSFQYLPLLSTKRVIDWLREISDIPIVVGGFGFATMPERIMPFLGADYGIQGCVDPFLENFEKILTGPDDAREMVPNLVYRSGDRFLYNRRTFGSPLQAPEYDEDIIDDITNFYGFMHLHHAKVWRRVSRPTLPIEVMRGCPNACYFCTEPSVMGKQCRYRDLDAVIADIDFLVSRAVRNFWLVCSEINAEGNEFFFRLAERIKDYQTNSKVKFNWQTYYIPKLNYEEVKYLQDTGFLPGWTEFLSLDDENLSRCRVPYTSRDVIDNLKHHLRLNPQGFSQLTLFLGNAFCTRSTIRKTLSKMDEHGLLNQAAVGRIVECTRVFDLGSGPICGDGQSMISLGEDLLPLDKPEFLYPTFHYSRHLVDELGNKHNIAKMFEHLDRTFIRKLPDDRSRDWNGFLYDSISQEDFLHILDKCDTDTIILECFNRCVDDGNPDHRRVIDRIFAIVNGVARDKDRAILKRLFRPRGAEGEGEDIIAYMNAAKFIIDDIIEERRRVIIDIIDCLEIPHHEGRISLSCYSLNKHMNSRFSDRETLIGKVIDRLTQKYDKVSIRFFLEYFLFVYHINFQYAGLFY